MTKVGFLCPLVAKKIHVFGTCFLGPAHDMGPKKQLSSSVGVKNNQVGTDDKSWFFGPISWAGPKKHVPKMHIFFLPPGGLNPELSSSIGVRRTRGELG